MHVWPDAAPVSNNSVTRHFQKLMACMTRLLATLHGDAAAAGWREAALRATNGLVLCHVLFKFAAEHLPVERMLNLLVPPPGPGA